MSGNPTDASLQEGEFEILVAVQQAGTKHAGKAGHDWEYARQHPIRKVVLKQFVDEWKLEAEVNRDGQIQPVGFGEERVVVGMIQPLRAGRSIDHYGRRAQLFDTRQLFGCALGILERNNADSFETIGRLLASLRQPSVICTAYAVPQNSIWPGIDM